MNNFIKLALLCGFALQTSFTYAGTISDTFSTGTTLTATHMNNVKNAVNDNDARIAALETALVTLQTELANTKADLATAQSDLAAANSSIASINNSNVMGLNPYLTIDTTGNATAIFSAINLQVVNGTGNTASINGLGNMIIGYNLDNLDTSIQVCADGSFADQVSCESNGSVWSNSHKTGSHNLVIGDANSYSSYAGMVAGNENFINRGTATVTGGYKNISSGFSASVNGGELNTASGLRSVVIGGRVNNSSGSVSVVSGGQFNTASGFIAAISGGESNQAIGSVSVVSGGNTNTANGSNSVVSGGKNRSTTGTYNWVAGTLLEAN